jgi:hypothetical protein
MPLARLLLSLFNLDALRHETAAPLASRHLRLKRRLRNPQTPIDAADQFAAFAGSSRKLRR